MIVVEGFPIRGQVRDWILALAQQARQEVVPLVFLATDRMIRQTLRSQDVPVVAHMDAAHQYLATQNRAPTPSPPRRMRRARRIRFPHRAGPSVARGQTLYRWVSLIASTILLLLALGTILAFRQYVAPGATIVVHPQSEQLTVEVPMSASLYVTAPDPYTGLVPADLVSVFHEIQRSGVTSGQQRVPKEKARGSVLARNVSGTSVTVPAATYVQTGTGQAIAFVTEDEITLAPDPQLQTLISIIAVEAGEEGNVPANSINTIAGNLAFRLQITNPTPTTGGSSAWQAVVTQQDQNTLQNTMLQEVRQQAYELLVPAVAEGHWLPPETVRVNIQWTTANFFTDEATQSLTLTMMVQITGLTVQTADLLDYIMSQVEANTPPGARLLAPTLNFQFQPEVVANPTEVSFTVESAATYVQAVDKAQIRTLVAGKTVQEAQQLLAHLAPDIQIQSVTQSVLPRLPRRIQVRTQFLTDTS